MKFLKKILALLLIASMVLSAVSCGGKGDDVENTDNGDDTSPVSESYTVKVVNPFGHPVQGVTVFIHEDGGADYNVCTVPTVTDSAGSAVFQLEKGKSYSVGLMGVHKAYLTKSGATRAERYAIDSVNTVITLDSNPDYSPKKYDLGDPIANLAITDIDGNSYMLYDLLAEKDALVLNFWFYDCTPCRSEFPALNSAYNAYKSDIELFAVNDKDPLAKVQSYAKDKGLTLDMHLVKSTAGSPLSLSKFDSAYYPTTVVVDRYGIISFMHDESVPTVATWEKLFAFFTADDYTHTIISDLSDIG